MHLPFERSDEVVVLALQEQTGALHGFLVLLEGGDALDTGCNATFDLVLEAGPRTVAIQLFVAVSDTEEPMHQVLRFSRETRWNIGTGVNLAISAWSPDDVYPRVILPNRQLQIGVILVISE